MNFPYQELEEAKNQIHSVALTIKELLEQVNSEFNCINSHNDWQGDASNYIAHYVTQISTSFDTVYQSIERSSTYLGELIQNNKNIEQSIINSVSNIQ